LKGFNLRGGVLGEFKDIIGEEKNCGWKTRKNKRIVTKRDLFGCEAHSLLTTSENFFKEQKLKFP
jgi:hypothetical protein